MSLFRMASKSDNDGADTHLLGIETDSDGDDGDTYVGDIISRVKKYLRSESLEGAFKVQKEMGLELLKEEIQGLEEQVKLLRFEEGSDRPSGTRFWAMVGHLGEDDACTCIACTGSDIRQATQDAVDEAHVYKKELNSVLGISRNGQSTLELERQRTREAVQRGSYFGRVGSYRGFGASAIKVRGASSSNTQPKKTQKKAKRPALAL
ncbi:hypothetical protein LTR08_001003 [Meristemomyces frigidus]|nr:hypothetical protein LTR08_001003 [Meristemomyces frigidus]